MFSYSDDEFGDKYGFSVSKQYGNKDSESTSLTELVNHMKQNKGTAIVHVYGHFMVVADYKLENGKEKLLVFDPAPGAGSNYNSIKRRNVTNAAGDWFELADLKRDGGSKGGKGSKENIEIDGYWLISPTGKNESAASNSTNPDKYPFPTRDLYYNSGSAAKRGDDVKWLQSVLLHLGYDIDVDGSYGPATTAVVKKFQERYGLSVDGKSGPKTRPKLKSVWGDVGHSWCEGVVTSEPTASSSGLKTYKCKYCELTKNEVIDPIKPDSSNIRKYIIGGKTFDKNIDHYTTTLSSSIYDPTFSNMLAALSVDMYDKSKITNAYNSLGFLENFQVEYDFPISNYNTCSFSIGFKDSEYNDDKICLVVLRGSITNIDWITNFNVSTIDEKHSGFQEPARFLYELIEKLLGENVKSSNVKYVITGHSRGAAIGNLLAVELMEHQVDEKNVYNYNYACPDVACKKSFPLYTNIFNFCNRADIVPYLPGPVCSALTTSGTSWGKYGRTYWFTNSHGNFKYIENHKGETYLEFFDLKMSLSNFPYSEEDKNSDSARTILGLITKIFCPVDAIVLDKDGNQIASVINGEVSYYDNSFGEVIIFTDGDKKIIYIADESKFDVKLIGTDTGTMYYSVEKCDLSTGEIFESKSFSEVALEDGKTMFSPVSDANEINSVELFVVEENNGKTVYTHTINTDGEEKVYVNNDKSGDFDLLDKFKSLPKTAKIIIGAGIVIVFLLIICCCCSSGKKKSNINYKNNYRY